MKTHKIVIRVRTREGAENQEILADRELANQAINAISNKESLMIQNPYFAGAVRHTDILQVYEIQKEKSENNSQKLRFEIDPPNKKTWKYICKWVEEKIVKNHSGLQQKSIFIAMCRSVWEWDNEKTKKIIVEGREILKLEKI